jgi:hypothetical protein
MIITFNGIAPPNGQVSLGSPGTFTSSGVTFTGGAGNFFWIIDQGVAPSYNTGSASAGGVLSSQNAPFLTPTQVINITLPSSFSAIGFDTNTFADATILVTLSNGEALSLMTTGTTGRFFGFTTDIGITSFKLTSTQISSISGRVLNIDDFTFGQAQVVPEPTTMLLLGTGLVAVGATVRRRCKFEKSDKP